MKNGNYVDGLDAFLISALKNSFQQSHLLPNTISH